MLSQQGLRELENQCIQEHAPECAATCPIHVNFRGMAAAIQSGNFTEALKVFAVTVPFYQSISRVCEQPCQKACKRSEIGGPIEINRLELAAVQHGQKPPAQQPLPSKNKRVAVIGSGISGLTAAYDLARKGYQVEIFEAADKAGGRLANMPQEKLPADLLRDDISRVEAMGVKIHLNRRIDDLSALRDEYDAVYLGMGSQDVDKDPLLAGLETNAETYQTNLQNVFIGGGALAGQVQPAIIFAMMDGRRAATSMDRFLQKVSLTAARVNEGPYQTRLFTSLEGICPRNATPAASENGEYTVFEAVVESGRCLLCECMECVKVCEYLEHYGAYPKKYVREIYNNLSIVMGTRFSNKLINSCSLCGLCGVVCPESLDMGTVNKNARQVMVEQKRMPASAHDFALRDMAFSTSDQFAMIRHQPGKSTSKYLFFPGCQLAASSPDYVKQVYEGLRGSLGNDGEVGVGLMLGCCGAPADWAGRTELFGALQDDFMTAYKAAGEPELILACSSCYRTFKAQYPELKITSLWEVWEQHDLPVSVHPAMAGKTLTVHDPCSSREEPQVQQSVRRLLEKMGVSYQELELSKKKTECCSYGGNMWLTHPELAEKVRQRRVDYNNLDYLAYCAMCRDFYARQGKPTLHLLDLIYGSDPTTLAASPGPTLSQRHENRARLKRSLLRELWSEEMDAPQAYESIKLIVSDEIQTMLDKRLILIEDLQQVIEYAERTGKRFLNTKTGHYLASHKPAVVTYWVEYTPQADAYLVHKAYSHRMSIGEENAK